MLESQASYEVLLKTSERVAFALDDVFSRGEALDFTRPFLPESLARVRGLTFLDRAEQLRLNHIRAHGYLSMFGLVEEFILPFVLDHIERAFDGSRTRALLQFASEEAKHIELFRRFKESFQRDFAAPCETAGDGASVAKAVLSHSSLGVALTTLHIEWMTQLHYLESVRSDETLDGKFRGLLKHHFIEECQHAQLDARLALELAVGLGAEERAQGCEDYFAIVRAFDQLLVQQVELDLESLARVTGRTLSEAQKSHFRVEQLAAQRFTFLGSGMNHPRFVEVMRAISATAAERLAEESRWFV